MIAATAPTVFCGVPLDLSSPRADGHILRRTVPAPGPVLVERVIELKKVWVGSGGKGGMEGEEKGGGGRGGWGGGGRESAHIGCAIGDRTINDDSPSPSPSTPPPPSSPLFFFHDFVRFFTLLRTRVDFASPGVDELFSICRSFHKSLNRSPTDHVQIRYRSSTDHSFPRDDLDHFRAYISLICVI